MKQPTFAVLTFLLSAPLQAQETPSPIVVAEYLHKTGDPDSK